MSDTISYYSRTADQFIQNTVHTNMDSLYKEFVPQVSPNGTILDLGCGSGRDTLYFSQQGFHVVPLDATKEFVAHTFRLTGIQPVHTSFADMELAPQSFDAVWACASLLHVPRTELADVLKKIRAALKPQGILYLSFKYGTFEGMRNGRYFTDMDESSLASLMDKTGDLSLHKQWISEDVRPDKKGSWLNALYRKE